MRKPALSRVRDMTEGNPLKLILAFAVPLFIGNIFQQFYSMVDTMVVGYHLGDTGIAIIYLFGGSLVRFTTGTTDEEMLRYAVMSLRIHFSTFPFLGVVFVMRHTLQAMGYKIIPILSSTIELCTKFFAAGWLIPKIGFLGTCVTEPVTWAIMTVFLVVFYMGKRPEMAEGKA